ncbi:HSP20-like chaperone [Cyathus striatus]|nr:HSP20-like chaperone [Cyathus striatus]
MTSPRNLEKSRDASRTSLKVYKSKREYFRPFRNQQTTIAHPLNLTSHTRPIFASTPQVTMSSVFFYEPFYDFDRFFEEALNGNSGRVQRHPNTNPSQNNANGAVRSFKPRMDLHEDAEKNVVTASFEFPGLRKEDIQLDLHDGRLVVSAERKISSEHNEEGYAVRERQFGKFSRALQLPKGVKDEEIKASMEDGVLTVTFPKSAPEEAPKKITIS